MGKGASAKARHDQKAALVSKRSVVMKYSGTSTSTDAAIEISIAAPTQ